MRQNIVRYSHSDGTVTKSEHKLIGHIQKKLPELQKYLDEMFADEKLHLHEKKLFRNLLKQLLDETVEIAKEDKKVDHGESVIIKFLRKEMIELLNYLKSI